MSYNNAVQSCPYQTDKEVPQHKNAVEDSLLEDGLPPHHKKMIRVFPVRFGLFCKGSQEGEVQPVSASSNLGAPDISLEVTEVRKPLENKKQKSKPQRKVSDLLDRLGLKVFEYYETGLHPGYLYVLYNSEYYEYEVSEYGLLRSILHTPQNDGEVRIARTAFRHPYLEFEQDSRVKLCYSPVQLSVQVFKDMLDQGNDLVVEVKCTGFEPGAPAVENLSPYDRIVLFFTDRAYAARMQYRLDRIGEIEEEETRQGNNTLLEDMFVSLQDPVGCVTDVTAVLEDEHHKFDALLESVSTGREEKKVLSAIRQGENPAALPSPEESRQIASLLILAQTMYQVFYNENAVVNQDGDRPDNKYVKNINLKRIERLLGMKERQEQRDFIKDIRADFSSLLFSPYGELGFGLYLNNYVGYWLLGRFLLSTCLKSFSVFPGDKERGMVLQDKVEKSDRLVDYFETLLTTDTYPALSALLFKPLPMDTLVDEEEANTIKFKSLLNSSLAVANMFASVYKDVSEGFVKAGTLDLPKTICNSFTYRNQPIVQINKNNLDKIIQEQFHENVQFDVTDVVNKRGQQGVRFTRIHRDSPALREENGQFKLLRYPKLDKFLNSVKFGSTIWTLEAINLVILLKNWDGSMCKTVKVFSSASNTLSLGIQLINLLLSKQGQGLSIKWVRAGLRLGYVSAGINIAISAWETYDFYSKKDTDAAIASAGVTLLSGAMLFFMVVGMAASMLVVGILLIAASVLVIILTDDDLESFLKNNILAESVKDYYSTSLRPDEYVRQLYVDRKNLVPSSEYIDFQKACCTFTDFFPRYSSCLLFENTIDANFLETYNTGCQGGDVSYHTVYVPKIITVRFNLGLVMPEGAELECYLVIGDVKILPGIREEYHWCLRLPKGVKIVDDCMNCMETKDGLVVDYYYSVDKTLLKWIRKNKSVVTVISRYSENIKNQSGEELAWPVGQGNEKRYVVQSYHSYVLSSADHTLADKSDQTIETASVIQARYGIDLS